jgi:hypothetical protein
MGCLSGANRLRWATKCDQDLPPYHEFQWATLATQQTAIVESPARNWCFQSSISAQRPWFWVPNWPNQICYTEMHSITTFFPTFKNYIQCIQAISHFLICRRRSSRHYTLRNCGFSTVFGQCNGRKNLPIFSTLAWIFFQSKNLNIASKADTRARLFPL